MAMAGCQPMVKPYRLLTSEDTALLEDCATMLSTNLSAPVVLLMSKRYTVCSLMVVFLRVFSISMETLPTFTTPSAPPLAAKGWYKDVART